MLWIWWALRKLYHALKPSGSRRSPPPDVKGTAQDVRVEAVDGDTIKVEGVPRKIRLARIDAPEKGEPGAERARQFVERAIGEADEVRIEGDQGGHYGRYVAEVEVDGRNLSDMLLERGLADRY